MAENNLSNNPSESFSPIVAIFSNNIYVVWQDGSTQNFNILFTKSFDNGTTFSDPTQLNGNAGSIHSPYVAAFGNNVYVVWIDTLSDGSDDVIFTRSSDNGETFGDPIRLNSNSSEFDNPLIGASGSNVYVVWNQQLTTLRNGNILFTKSSDNGETFSKPLVVNADDQRSFRTDIATSGSNVYVIWDIETPTGDSDILFTKSSDNGETFSDPVRLNVDSIIEGTGPFVAASGSKVYAVWTTSEETTGLFMTASSDMGDTFSDPELIYNQGYIFGFQVVAVDNSVYVAFVTNGETYMIKGSADGLTLNSSNFKVKSDTKIDFTTGKLGLNVLGDNIYLIWSDKGEIFFQKASIISSKI
jgi:hypothetical protein